MANIITGNELILYIDIAGVPSPVCHSKDTKLNIAGDLQETTTKDGGTGKRYEYKGKNGFTLQVNGLTNLIDTANFAYFQDVVLNKQKIPFVFTDGVVITYTGTVLCPSVDIDSPDNAISSFNTTLIGDGVLSKTVAPPPIPSNIVNIIDQFSNILASVTSPGTYQVLKYDTIDEAGWPAPNLIIVEGQ